jgi:hypothetical protein
MGRADIHGKTRTTTQDHLLMANKLELEITNREVFLILDFLDKVFKVENPVCFLPSSS